MTPTLAQVNHDLGLLYIIARTILPKEILEVLLYGEGFEEPDAEDMENLRYLYETNRRRGEVQPDISGRGEGISNQTVEPCWNN